MVVCAYTYIIQLLKIVSIMYRNTEQLDIRLDQNEDKVKKGERVSGGTYRADICEIFGIEE